MKNKKKLYTKTNLYIYDEESASINQNYLTNRFVLTSFIFFFFSCEKTKPFAFPHIMLYVQHTMHLRIYFFRV